MIHVHSYIKINTHTHTHKSEEMYISKYVDTQLWVNSVVLLVYSFVGSFILINSHLSVTPYARHHT